MTGPGPAGGTLRYHRIADLLRAQILAGDYTPGQQLPAETTLMDLHTASRNTVRLALRRLTDEGLVVAGQGRGTFVRIRPQPLVWDLTVGPQQWAATVEAAGHRLSHDLQVTIVSPPQSIAARLGTPSDTTVVCRRRLQIVDGEPILLALTYITADLAHGTALAHPHDVPDIAAILADRGLPEARARHELATRPPTHEENQALNLPVATPVLEHTRTSYTDNGQPLLVTVTTLPGDQHLAVVDLPHTGLATAPATTENGPR